jgi:hypothetical protein
LQRIFRILRAAGGEPGKPVQLPLVAVEQLVEGVAVAGDMGCQQFGVTAFPLDVSPETHGRTVTNRSLRGTSPRRACCESRCELPVRMQLEP